MMIVLVQMESVDLEFLEGTAEQELTGGRENSFWRLLGSATRSWFWACSMLMCGYHPRV